MTEPIKPANDAEIREIEQRLANGDDNPWSAYMVEALIARIKQEVSLNNTSDGFYKATVAERNLAWHQLEDLRQQLTEEEQRSAHRYQEIQRLKAQERILLEWQRDACKVVETAACECDDLMGFHCLRCGLLDEVHPDQRSSV